MTKGQVIISWISVSLLSLGSLIMAAVAAGAGNSFFTMIFAYFIPIILIFGLAYIRSGQKAKNKKT